MSPAGRLRTCTPDDSAQVIALWAQLFDETDPAEHVPWRGHARTWFAGAVADPGVAHFPGIDIDGEIVATAIGTLELGVPNPQCPTGRTARLANVVTLPEHRRNGYGTQLVDDVIRWARTIAADRVDLSATPDGQRLYARAGFVLTSAPRMKLVL